jgi:hypothetical protein
MKCGFEGLHPAVIEAGISVLSFDVDCSCMMVFTRAYNVVYVKQHDVVIE